MKLKIKLSKNKGATLTELIVASSITGVIGAGILVFMTRQQEASKILQYSLNMQTIYNQVEKIASDPTSIRLSASISQNQGNKELANCLSTPEPDKPVELCQKTDPLKQTEIELFKIPKDILKKFQNKVASENELRPYKAAGTVKKPALYDIGKGIICSKNSRPDSVCSIEVRAFFWATCPTNSIYLGDIDDGSGTPTTKDTFIPTPTPKTCITAQSINIRFQVTHNYSVREKKSINKKIIKINRRLPSLPRETVFWKDFPKKKTMSTYNTLTTPVNIIPKEDFLFFQCPLNYIMTGIKSEEPICECLYPFRKENCVVCGKYPPCIAVKKKCGPNERYRGNKENGDPICEEVYCEEYKSASLGCKAGGWIESIKNRYWNNANDSNLEHVPEGINNSCAVIADACIVGKNGGACDANYYCNLRIRCCYEVRWSWDNTTNKLYNDLP